MFKIEFYIPHSSKGYLLGVNISTASHINTVNLESYEGKGQTIFHVFVDKACHSNMPHVRQVKFRCIML